MRVVLVDDHPVFVESLSIALPASSGFVVVGAASCARETYCLVEVRRPDLLVVDLLLPDTDGVSLVRELRRRRWSVPVLILTRSGHGHFVRDAFRAGANGYVLKHQPLAEVIEAMESVVRGERYLSPTLCPLYERAVGGDRDVSARQQQLERLSGREREIFCRLVEGLTSKEIARFLCISVRTVENHRLHINRKLGVRSPAELLSFAAVDGLVL
jgi:DNA-binding NarL/FixJ family response regulator